MFYDVSSYLGLWLFVILMVSTPGPANLLCMSAGASYGFRANLAFMAGLISGKLLLNMAIAFGFGALLIEMPLLKQALSVIAACYLIVLALRGWNAGVSGAKAPPPLHFINGVFVHPLNPKAWVMATLAYTQFISGLETDFEKYALSPLSFLIAQLVFHGAWCWAGALLKTQLGTKPLLNRGLILLTIIVVLWALTQA